MTIFFVYDDKNIRFARIPFTSDISFMSANYLHYDYTTFFRFCKGDLRDFTNVCDEVTEVFL